MSFFVMVTYNFVKNPTVYGKVMSKVGKSHLSNYSE